MTATSDSKSFPHGLTLLRFDPSSTPCSSPGVVRRIVDSDRDAVAALIEEAQQSPEMTYIVDMIGVEFCGTMRLGVLLRIHHALRKNGRLLRIAVDHPELQEVFRLTRLNTIMAVFASLQTAIDEASDT